MEDARGFFSEGGALPVAEPEPGKTLDSPVQGALPSLVPDSAPICSYLKEETQLETEYLLRGSAEGLKWAGLLSADLALPRIPFGAACLASQIEFQ